MSIYTNVKDVNDFGKRKIVNNLYEYEQRHARPKQGDLIVYYYPNDNMLGVYQVTKELEYYNKDGYEYSRGEMLRVERSAEQLINDLKKTHLGFANELEKVIIDLINKYKSK